MTHQPDITIALVQGPLDAEPARHPNQPTGRSGAILSFEGVVRKTEAGRDLSALKYQAYEPMTTQELHRLSAAVTKQHGLHGLWVRHSIGTVPVGSVSFRLCVASAHRLEALCAMTNFIDQMKQNVPLWKLPIWSDLD